MGRSHPGTEKKAHMKVLIRMGMLGVAYASVLLACNALVYVCNSQVRQQAENIGQFRSPFRYVILSGNCNGAENRRFIEVLMDNKAFSERNLKEMFRLLAARFPAPQVLHIDVYTNLEDVSTPEESDEPALSSMPDRVGADKYHQAFFLRDAYGNEWFTYNPNPPLRRIKKVIIKSVKYGCCGIVSKCSQLSTEFSRYRV
jgi:hypothetical protein